MRSFELCANGCNLERPSELSWRARHGREKKIVRSPLIERPSEKKEQTVQRSCCTQEAAVCMLCGMGRSPTDSGLVRAANVVKTTHERCGPFSLCRLEPNVSHNVCSQVKQTTQTHLKSSNKLQLNSSPVFSKTKLS